MIEILKLFVIVTSLPVYVCYIHCIIYVHICISYICGYYIFRPKHPLKVHVWAGISLKGPTKIIIFEGMMDAPLYVEVLKTGLIPFLAEKFPMGHRFMQASLKMLNYIFFSISTYM